MNPLVVAVYITALVCTATAIYVSHHVGLNAGFKEGVRGCHYAWATANCIRDNNCAEYDRLKGGPK